MSRSFLGAEEKDEFLKAFKSPAPQVSLPRQGFYAEVLENSLWLENRLFKKLRSFGEWDDLHPILLGSWARSELCPCSDLDVLFLGEHEKVFKFVSRVQEEGLKIRYRVPQDPADWTQGVQDFDVLALLSARAITAEGEKSLTQQQSVLQQQHKIWRSRILKACLLERKKRQQRLDSITNFLEPNLKYTPGGLRDIQQGLQIFAMSADKIQGEAHALDILRYYKEFLLLLRQRLHAESSQDILSGNDQLVLSEFLGFKNLSSFMKAVQRGLSRSFFYSEWILHSSHASSKKLRQVQSRKLQKPSDLWQALEKQPDVLMQKRVRESIDAVFSSPPRQALSTNQVKGLEKILHPKSRDEFVVAVFSSRLIDKLLPPVAKLVGHVQHDQYHRFTADLHIQQACRQFLRVRASARELGLLKFLHRQLSKSDWTLVGWACLFHDLSKGQGGDHSHQGAEKVLAILPRPMGKNFRKELSWLVENHLLLSTLAFRRSAFSWQTFEELQAHDVTEARLRRLAVFTVIDIKATNPEAWNAWKAQLIKDFLSDLKSPEGQSQQKFLIEARKVLPKMPSEAWQWLDSFLLQRLAPRTLLKDLKGLLTEKPPSSVKVFKVAGRTWVRFYEASDRPGLLTDFVDRLHQVGANILHASVQTLGNGGVYDWFQVQMPVGREKWLHKDFKVDITSTVSARFEEIHLSALGGNEWMVSLKGQEQKGLLKFACRGLSALGANIKSARVHTWGLKVEDIFVISYDGEEAELKEKIISALGSR